MLVAQAKIYYLPLSTKEDAMHHDVTDDLWKQIEPWGPP